jgi:hypothetical protein
MSGACLWYDNQQWNPSLQGYYLCILSKYKVLPILSVYTQGKLDDFQEIYNHDRPHEALSMKYPGEVYTPSARIYEPPSEPEYPFHERTIRVTKCGRICIGRRKINLSSVFAGQTIGITDKVTRYGLSVLCSLI